VKRHTRRLSKNSNITCQWLHDQSKQHHPYHNRQHHHVVLTHGRITVCQEKDMPVVTNRSEHGEYPGAAGIKHNKNVGVSGTLQQTAYKSLLYFAKKAPAAKQHTQLKTQQQTLRTLQVVIVWNILLYLSFPGCAAESTVILCMRGQPPLLHAKSTPASQLLQ